MAKQKVSELPKEEQDALLSEAKAAGLRMGLVQGWTVETLKKRIEEAKTNKQNEGDNEADGEQNGDGETPETEEATEGEDGEQDGDNEAPEDEETNEDGDNTPEDAPPVEAPKTPKQTKKAEAKKEPEEEKTYICHICRSKVTKGKCTGCGFSVGG